LIKEEKKLETDSSKDDIPTKINAAIDIIELKNIVQDIRNIKSLKKTSNIIENLDGSHWPKPRTRNHPPKLPIRQPDRITPTRPHHHHHASCDREREEDEQRRATSSHIMHAAHGSAITPSAPRARPRPESRLRPRLRVLSGASSGSAYCYY
jgi:hypothetical protein